MVKSYHRTGVSGLVGILPLALILLAGCSKKVPDSSATAVLPALPVRVHTVATEPVVLSRELPGRTAPYRVAEVRARVDGIVLERLFEEGAVVEKGQTLFRIDPAPYEVALQTARAALARAEANHTAVKTQVERLEGLVDSHAISRQAYDDAVAQEAALRADIASGLAAVRQAEIQLEYTHVVSPIGGRIGRAEVTEGAYVRMAEANLLATVLQLDPLYVDLSQSAEELLRLKRAVAAGNLEPAAEQSLEFSLILEDGRMHPRPGTLQFSDVSVNPSTGTVLLRGIVPNPESDLLPGMFVRARLVEGTIPDGILVPQSVTSRNARGEATAFLVGPDNQVEYRVLQASRAVGNQWLITGGLEPGEQVILDNLQKIRPGLLVTPAPQGESAQLSTR